MWKSWNQVQFEIATYVIVGFVNNLSSDTSGGGANG